MPSFATLWWPRLDPFGPALAIAAALVAVAWILAEVPALSRARGLLLVTSLLFFSLFLVASAADLVALSPLHLRIKYKRFPDLSDYLANYLVLGAGAVFGLKLSRMGNWWREIGIMSFAIFGGVALAELCGLLCYSHES
jgi:hypothetical protein